MESANLLADAYARTGIPLDRLPYSPDFDRLCEAARDLGVVAKSQQEVWKALVNLRKRGCLPRVGRNPSS